MTVDGRELWSTTTDEMMAVCDFRSQVQPDFTVFPTWKVFKGASFDGYRYRLIGSERGTSAAAGS